MSEMQVMPMDKDVCFSPDDLTASDVLSAVMAGLIGAAVSTSDKLKAFLHEIHSDASLKNPRTLAGRLLHHAGDAIDRTTRGGKPFATYLHRLYGGHDIFSVGHGDNPFVLLCKQYGIPRGILQAIRHLVADTFSKNGGVLPGSSFLDFVREDGTVGNYIDEWSKEIASGTGLSSQEVYAELFAIKMQDVASVSVIDVLLKAYKKGVSSITGTRYSDIAASQLRIIALFTAAIGSAGIGAIKHKGVVKNNIPVLAALASETVRLLRLNEREIKEISRKNDNLEERVVKLESEAMDIGRSPREIKDSSQNDNFEERLARLEAAAAAVC